MRHRFLIGLLVITILMLTSFLAAYRANEHARGYIGPGKIQLESGRLSYIPFHSPGWTLLNVSCNGRGSLLLKDQFSGGNLLDIPVESHVNRVVVIPHEGTYALYTNGSMFCSGYISEVHPTSRTQGVLWVSVGVLSVLLAFLLWRWWS